MATELRPVDLSLLKELRAQHAAQMHGAVQACTESQIIDSGALHVGLHAAGRLRGYASFGPEDQRGGRALLEIFVAEGERRDSALPFLREVIGWVPPTVWEVNSYDRFALSLAANAGYKLDRTESLLFSLDKVTPMPESDFRLATARPSELEEMRPILMEDSFYTVDWRRLPFEIEVGRWFNLRSPGGVLIGIGYIEPVVRSPGYADVGMVTTSRWRRQGHGRRILQGLVQNCLGLGLKPVGVCAWGNTASRRSLEGAGFYCDGRIWKVKTQII